MAKVTWKDLSEAQQKRMERFVSDLLIQDWHPDAAWLRYTSIDNSLEVKSLVKIDKLSFTPKSSLTKKGMKLISKNFCELPTVKVYLHSLKKREINE